MKHAFTYHGHVIVANTVPIHWPNPESIFEGISITCTTASLPYVIVQAVLFAVKHNIRSLVVDGVELKITNLPKSI